MQFGSNNSALATPVLFKEAMSRVSYSVSVVGTEAGGRLYGKTINTLMPVSAGEPSVLVSLHRDGQLTPKIIQSRKFCVSVLSDEQKQVAEDFAVSAEANNPFDCWSWSRLETGAPCIDGAITCFDCELAETLEFATHVLCIGRIVVIKGGDLDRPLLHYRRAYRSCPKDVIQ